MAGTECQQNNYGRRGEVLFQPTTSARVGAVTVIASSRCRLGGMRLRRDSLSRYGEIASLRPAKTTPDCARNDALGSARSSGRTTAGRQRVPCRPGYSHSQRSDLLQALPYFDFPGGCW